MGPERTNYLSVYENVNAISLYDKATMSIYIHIAIFLVTVKMNYRLGMVVAVRNPALLVVECC